MEERLQKILSRAGFGSRRTCEELIAKGRVSVNGKIARPGTKADPDKDDIRVDMKPIKVKNTLIYIALHKPRKVLCTLKKTDTRKILTDIVDIPDYVFPVGRLDYESEGLVLLTNDGELANTLTHPRYAHEKEYKVLVASRPDKEQLNAWRRGIVLKDGVKTAPAKVTVLSYHGKGAWLRVVLKEGRKRQIREMGALTGLPVVRIIRTRIATLRLGNLKRGEWRHLTREEISSLKSTKRKR